MKSIEQIIIECLKETLKSQKGIDSPAVDQTSKYGETFGWDSMTHMFFFLNLEEKFCVSIPRYKLIELDSISKIAEEIKELQSEK